MKKVQLLFLLILCQYMSSFAQDTPTFYLRGLLEMWRKNASTTQKRIEAYNKLIPVSLQPYVVHSLNVSSAWFYTKNVSNYTSFTDDNYLELCKRVDSTGISFVVNVAEIGNYDNPIPEPPDTFPVTNPVTTSYYLRPSQVDKIFANTKNCIGIESGENFWTYNSTTVNDVLNFLRVCKKYNKKYILGDGGWGYATLARFLSDNYATIKNEGLGQYFVPVFKNTKPYGALINQSAVMGAWITGLTSGFGTWNDEWAWTYMSFRNANEFPSYTKADGNYTRIPFTHYLKSWLLTIAMGGNTAFMETPTFSRSAIADANFTPYLLPFIKGIIEHNIMPSKAAVLSKVKAIANPFGTYTLSTGNNATYRTFNLVSYQNTVVPYLTSSSATYAEPYGLLYKNTYGIWNDTAYTNTGSVTDRYYNYVKNATNEDYLLNAIMREVFPNNARFLIIPLLPNTAAVSSIPAGIEKVDLNLLTTENAVRTKFNSLYPANNNSAWATEIDSSFFVINSHENADINQSFAFSLGNNIIESLSGEMPFQNLLFGKREDTDNFWFQSNGYAVANGSTIGQRYVCTVKKTVLQFKCKSEPVVEIEDNKASSVIKSWNNITKMLQLEISHTNGAVNFRIKSATAPLPVKLLSFTAKYYQQQTLLNWKANELGNFSHYEIEYSADATNFLLVEKVKEGKQTGEYTYKHYINASLVANAIYYRLKMVDADGTSTYSAIQKVVFGDSQAALKIIPTVANNAITIVTNYNIINSTCELLVYDAQGRVVLKEARYVIGTAINISNLEKGLYKIQLLNNQKTFQSQFIKI